MSSELDYFRAERQRLQIEMLQLTDTPDDPSTRVQLLVLEQKLEHLINQMSIQRRALKKQMGLTTEVNQAVNAYARAAQMNSSRLR